MAFTTNIIPKHISRLSNIFLRGDCESTLYLEVITDFIDKEVIENIYEPNSQFSDQPPKREFSERILKKWSESTIYNFREVTPAELFNLRLSKVPGIVCKRNGKLFYTQVPASLRINGRESLGVHLCGKQCSKVCNGCPRTPSLTVAYQQNTLDKDFLRAVKDSWRLEKFDFVHSGIEAFNMENSCDACLIFRCDDFEVSKRPSVHSVNKKLKLAGAYWDDFNGNRSEMLARIKENERGMRK